MGRAANGDGTGLGCRRGLDLLVATVISGFPGGGGSIYSVKFLHAVWSNLPGKN